MKSKVVFRCFFILICLIIFRYLKLQQISDVTSFMSPKLLNKKKTKKKNIQKGAKFLDMESFLELIIFLLLGKDLK